MRVLQIDNYVIKTPLIEIINRLRIELTNGKLKDIKDGENIVVTCPHHSNGLESSPACNVYAGDDPEIPYGYFKCWVCNEQGSFVKFVSECFNSSEDFAKKWLINNFGEKSGEAIELPERIDLDKIFNKHKATKKPSSYLEPSCLDAYQDWHPYLAKRKLSRTTCQTFKVKYDPFKKQIIFPCFNLDGKVIMMPRRSIDTKYFYLDKKQDKAVYCLDYIIKNNIKSAVITEGPFDCLTCYEYGVPAIATFGGMSVEQIAQINKSCINTLYIMFDNDDAGHRYAEYLKKYISKRIMLIEPKFPANRKDINDLSYEEFHKIIQK